MTIIEVLSPANKIRHRGRYISNRNAILSSSVHLVELDLLWNGDRLERKAPAQGPVIPVPLKAGAPDVPLDLPRLFRDVYVSSRYRLQLDYTTIPPLSEEEGGAIAVLE